MNESGRRAAVRPNAMHQSAILRIIETLRT